MAGLIEGAGWFGDPQLSYSPGGGNWDYFFIKKNWGEAGLHIAFAESDVSLAYLIKKRIGYGSVCKIKDKKAVRYLCKKPAGLLYILSLINGKLVSKPRYNQLINLNYAANYKYNILPPTNRITLDNPWLAGFTQAVGCFHISITTPARAGGKALPLRGKTGFNVKLEFSIKEYDREPLKLIYDIYNSGDLSLRSKCGTGIWCYKSSDFKTAEALIKYFDSFNVFSSKYVAYLKYRKVYIMVTNGQHLEEKGITKIKSIAAKGSSETSTQEVNRSFL